MSRREIRNAPAEWRATPQQAHRPPAAPKPKPRVTVKHLAGYLLAGFGAYMIVSALVSMATAH